MTGGQKWWNATAPALLSILAVAIYSSAGLTEFCQYDRTRIEGWEVWRLVSGNFAHWSGEHIFWDLLVFAVLGILISLRHRISVFILLALSSISISATVYFIHPSMQYYRGLSGIDSALFIYFGLDFISASIRNGKYRIAFAGISLILLLAAKTVFEIISGTNLFVVSGSFVPVVTAHLAGIFTGILVFLVDNSCAKTQDV